MIRVHNWDAKLVAWAEAVRGRPFLWGATDCASLVREAMRAMYGRDLWPDLGHWTGLRSARDALATSGGVEAQMRLLGATEVAPGYIQQGDVLLWPPVEGEMPSASVRVSGRWLSNEVGGHVTLDPGEAEGVILRMPNG